MKNNWQEVKLDNVCELIAGFAFKSKDFGAYPDKVVKITNIEPPFVNMTNLVGVDLSKYNRNNLAKFIVKRGDYVLAMTGATIGKLGRISNDDIAYINQRVLKFKPNDGVDKDFLFFILSESNFSQYILNHIDSESAQANISAKTIGQYEFELPPLDAQKRISAVLGSLDNKIELNNKINQNLEAQAQAIFKSWFVDFEPFGGKMPADWNIAELRAVCKTITKGTTPTTLKKAFVDKGVNFIKAESILSNHTIDLSKIMFIDDETNELLSRSQIKPFDILYTIAGTIGRFSMVMPTQIPANTNQAVAIIRCIDEYKFFIYNMFLCGCHTKYLITKVVQAVQANLSLAAIGSLPIIQPSQNALEKYLKLITPIFSAIFKNNEESRRLSQLRDTLLPKLMSGEIDVSDVAV